MSMTPFGQDKFLTINGLQLHYVEWGSPGNPSLVLLHGFQSNAHTWDTFSQAMADTYHVLALDQRGHGDTSWAPDGDYAPTSSVSDIAGFITALHLAPTVVIGHSMGGRHAAMVAAEHPEKVQKVVIVDTAAEMPPAILGMRSQQPATDAAPQPETFDTFEEVVQSGIKQYPLTPEAELRHANYHNLYRGADGKWRWRWDINLLQWRRLNRSPQGDLYTYLQRIHCPTLLIRGQRSPLLTPEVAEKMIQARFCYRPFDIRWIYWEPETRLLGEKVSAYFPHVFDGNYFLFTTGRTRKSIIEPALYTQLLNDLNCMDSGARGFPLYLLVSQERLFDEAETNEPKPNLSREARTYLRQLGTTTGELFYHALTTLHAPTYRTESTGALRQDWPRVPLPDTAELLRASAALGRQIAELLDTERHVPSVTNGKLRPELQAIGVITRVGGGTLNPSAGDLAVTAGWGHAGKGGVTMPGKGRVDRRAYTPDELAAIRSGASALGCTEEQTVACLGATTSDVYLNDVAYWRNVPASVWSYTIGGYQVIKKWLSYREHGLLGRALTTDEAREVTHMARRIAAIVLLYPALDANYLAVKQATVPWPGISKDG